MKRFNYNLLAHVFVVSLLWLTACDVNKINRLKVSPNQLKFLSVDNTAKIVKVTTNLPTWTFEKSDEWFHVEQYDESLIVTVDDLVEADVSRKGTIRVTVGNSLDEDFEVKSVTVNIEQSSKIHIPRLRGVMIDPDFFKPEDLKALAGDWKANHIRWQFNWGNDFPNGPADTASIEEYNAWIDQQCEQLDKMLPELERCGVRVTLDLHTPPGGRLGKGLYEMRMFKEKQFQDAFVATWQKLAQRYKDAQAIWSYDLLNEPMESAIIFPVAGKDLNIQIEGILNWRELALKTSKEIRKIDPDKTIVIEPAPGAEPYAFEGFVPFDKTEVPNVVYSVHMYLPHSFTHQGVKDFPLIGLVYPGLMPDGKYWDREQIRNSLQAVRDFANDYDVAIYVGEFGSIRWAPRNSSYRYLRDCIEIFEEDGWDWAYHAFREYDGWSAEHTTDQNNLNPAAEPTDRELLLRSWFEKNER